MDTTASGTRASLAVFVRHFLYLGSLRLRWAGGARALDAPRSRRVPAVDLGGRVPPGASRWRRSCRGRSRLAIALGYFQHGVVGAAAVGVAFIVPSFLMVVTISIASLTYGGLWWMPALFYGIGAVIGVIAIAASSSPGRRTSTILLL